MTQQDADARFWDKIARKYAQDPIADMAGYERTLEAVRTHLSAEARVLELGCGTGTTALKLAPHAGAILATDVSGEMIAIANEKAQEAGVGNVTFMTGTPEEAPFGEPPFDAVLAFNLLHLLKDQRAALEGVRRSLKPGGVFISKTPCLGEMNPLLRGLVPVMQMIGKAPHVRFQKAGALQQEIEAAGFEIVESAYHGSKKSDPRPYVVARPAS